MLSTIPIDDDAYKAALKCARGSYQYGLLRGARDWEGADVGLMRKEYRYSYRLSRINLLNRMLDAGIKFNFVQAIDHSKVMVVGTDRFITTNFGYLKKLLKTYSAEDAYRITAATALFRDEIHKGRFTREDVEACVGRGEAKDEIPGKHRATRSNP